MVLASRNADRKYGGCFRCLPAILAIATCWVTCGCHPFWNPAGARQVRYKEFDTIYYKTSVDRSKAYLFFSQPKCLLIGMSLSTTGETNVIKYGVAFGGVSNTEGHRMKYDAASMLHCTRTNGLSVMEFDTGEAMKDSPKLEFWMYYGTESSPWGIRIPYKGTTAD